MKHILLSFIITFNSTAWAQCPEDVQEITKGQTANCSGLLFSPEAAEKIDKTQQDLEYNEKLNLQLVKRQELMFDQNEVLDKRLQLYMNQSGTLAEALYEREQDSKWEKVLYFGLGVLATGVAVYGASKLND